MSNFRLKLQRSLLFGLLVFAVPALAQNSVLLSEVAARSADARALAAKELGARAAG